MYTHMLEARYRQTESLLCIGLDPFINIIRDRLGFSDIFEFNRRIIDCTHKYALCYKPQIAHYSAYGLEAALEKTIAHIRDTDPNIPVILDAKRADIGSTAAMYAREAFERYGADAVTVNPWLGRDGIEPFLAHEGKGVIVLAKTSNPSAGDIQDLDIKGKPCYLQTVDTLERHFPDNPQLQYVVGATYHDDIARMRQCLPQKWFLVPGIGAQGGDLTAVLAAGSRRDGGGLMISATRSILYPAQHTPGQDHFAQVAKAAQDLALATRPD